MREPRRDRRPGLIYTEGQFWTVDQSLVPIYGRADGSTLAVRPYPRPPMCFKATRKRPSSSVPDGHVYSYLNQLIYSTGHNSI